MMEKIEKTIERWKQYGCTIFLDPFQAFRGLFGEMLTWSTGYTEFVMENKNNQCLNINEID